jgi:hypothetical protein
MPGRISEAEAKAREEELPDEGVRDDDSVEIGDDELEVTPEPEGDLPESEAASEAEEAEAEISLKRRPKPRRLVATSSSSGVEVESFDPDAELERIRRERRAAAATENARIHAALQQAVVARVEIEERLQREELIATRVRDAYKAIADAGVLGDLPREPRAEVKSEDETTVPPARDAEPEPETEEIEVPVGATLNAVDLKAVVSAVADEVERRQPKGFFAKAKENRRRLKSKGSGS